MGSEPSMQLNADFSERVVVHSAELPWLDSPIPGVQRRMLDRIGDEVARATSVVRYAPGSQFSAHVHSGGEEFIVLDGVFQDEHGDYPVGSYIRNPPQSSHTPGSASGCVIFVKLWQFDPSDRTHVVSHIDRLASVPDALRKGVAVIPLYKDARENVRVEIWSPGSAVDLHAPGGIEVLVLDGSFQDQGDTLVQHSWLRVPVGGAVNAVAGADGARVWIKTGGLQNTAAPG